MINDRQIGGHQGSWNRDGPRHPNPYQEPHPYQIPLACHSRNRKRPDRDPGPPKSLMLGAEPLMVNVRQTGGRPPVL